MVNLNILLRGQSNAFLLGAFNGSTLVSRVQSLLGFDGVNDTVTLEFQHDAAVANTVYSGTSFLTEWLKLTAAGWQVGAQEQGLLNYINGLSAAQKAQPTAVVWLHSEYDSLYGALTPALWESGVRYDAALVRGAYGQSAATLPYLFVSAIPYSSGTGTGHQAIRTGMEELSADPAFNAGIAARIQDSDMTWDNPTGFGGSHMSFEDQRIASIRIAASLAEEWAPYAKPGSPVALAGGNIDNLGPQVIAASVSAPNQLMLKVQFDAASSLAPLDAAAAQGVGWTIFGPDGKATDGGAAALAIGAPDTMYVSFNGVIPAGAKLYYGWGYGRLEAANGTGQGHAVYDNAGLPIWVDAHGLAVGGGAAVAAAPVTGGASVSVGATGGSYIATAAAENWVIQPGSGHAVIDGFDPAVDTLTFTGIARESLITWQTSSTPGLGIAWNPGDGYVTLPGVGTVPESHILIA
ncbi:hypothetical protein E2C06_14260 [Dankookia rubra]|uniref:Uncharacterized protein n=1 Tax=Dankookia rubra TaxID=1442381 RepID=A0A4V3AA63_9PROT|nr:hypothetical protein [Dankookia rubra]TDH61905.1 hypothetical protein E2C06_14260 [Dankookia rubra]